jgi:Zn-dependent M28 family amino/carboxypeptidase
MRTPRWALGVAALLLGACRRPDPVETAMGEIRAEAIEAHLRFLASDLTEGRAPGTRGIEVAAEYVAAQFRRAGLAPAVGDTSYFQRVPFVGMTPDPQLAFVAGGRRFPLRYRDEFVAWSGEQVPEVAAEGEVVFVGYGTYAPEFDWDDYKDVDVTGKVLLVLVNDPGKTEPGRFRGDTLTYYGRWTYKFEEAARRGATGAVLVHTTELAGYPWSVVRASWGGEQFELPQRAGEPRVPVKGWIPWEVAARVLAAAGQDLDALYAAAQRPDFRPVETGVRMAARVRTRLRRIESSNVAGLLRGRARPDEVVVYTSHYDHLGIGTPVNGDSIYNGARDNASGTALLLALADAFARLPKPPERSVLFLAVTAEEQGLLGSRYYAENPLFPLEKTAANVNMDAVNVWGATEDIVVLGADRSTLGPIVEEAARAEGLVLEGDPFPGQGYFFRSDQFSFVRRGVPAAYVEQGWTFVGRPPGWGEARHAEYNERDYHQPSDEIRPDFDYAGAVQQGRVAFRIGWQVANMREFPEWLPGAEFKAIRDSMMARARGGP